MSKYCKAYALRVTYLDCMECETKECKGVQNVYKAYLRLLPEQECFLVFVSKREKAKKNVVLKCVVKECIVRKEETLYNLKPIKCVTDKKENIESYKQNFLCINSTIDTGIRKTQRDIYPVFTSKEKCLEWLKA